MNHCLDDQSLLEIHTGEGKPAQRAHLGGCLTCARRYRRLEEDLSNIVSALQRPPALPLEHATAIMPLWRWSLAAALVIGAFFCGRLTGLSGLSLNSQGPTMASQQQVDYTTPLVVDDDDNVAAASYTSSMDDLLTPVDAGPDFTIAGQSEGVN
ncbi:MAG TPA: hypothetical protein VKV28_12885 [Candidatus Binataceae bacterium]|nr:hypothetical protein [Candidatus Binataceae bacterium]